MDDNSNGDYKTCQLQKEINHFIEFQMMIEQVSASSHSSINTLIVFINENNLLGESKGQFYEFLTILSNSIKYYPKSKSIIICLLNHYKEDISQNFTSDELFSIFSSNKNLLLALYESNCITIRTLQSKFPSTSFNFPFFYPEFKSNIQFLTSEQKESIEKIDIEIQNKFNSNIATFLELREEGHSELTIAKLIRDDDIDRFSVLVSPENFNLNMKIPLSIYESDPLLQSKPSLIEYSCFFGSIKIFKFLWLKNLDVDQRIYSFAIAGNNTEIIHIIESKYPIEESDDNEILSMAISYQKPEIFEYFIENYNFLGLTHKMLVNSVISLDYVMFNCILQHILKEDPKCPIIVIENYRTKKVNYSLEQILKMKDVSGKNLLHFSCIYGNFEIVTFLCNLKSNLNDKNGNRSLLFDVNEKDNCHCSPIHYACKYDYLDIVKVLLNYYGNAINWNIEDSDF